MDGYEREISAHPGGRVFQAPGVDGAKALRHEHARGAREMLEQPGGRVGTEIAELMACEQGLIAMEWTLGLILRCQGAMRSYERGMMTLETLSVGE